MASERVKSDFPISLLLEGIVHIHTLIYHHTRAESWKIKCTVSFIFQSHVNSALVSQVIKHKLCIKTDIRIVVTRPISNLSKLTRDLIMGHFALERINHGRKRFTVRPKAVKITHLRSIEVSLWFYSNWSRTGCKVRWISWDIYSSMK
jgi:hypothetical protein